MRTTIALLFALAAPTVAQAQDNQGTALVATQGTEVTIPANTEIVLRTNEELSTKGGQVKVGQTFRLTVAYDVKVGGVVAIPAGTPAVGAITKTTGRAVFGKSGKMEIELQSVNLDGQRIPVTGAYKQNGEGNTVAAVGAVVLAAPLLFVTGKSAVIPRGRELAAYTAAQTTVKVK